MPSRPRLRARPRAVLATALTAALTAALAAGLLGSGAGATALATGHLPPTGEDEAGPEVVQVIEDHPDGTSTSHWVVTDTDGTTQRVRPAKARELQARQESAQPDVAAVPVPQAHRAYVATITGGDYGTGGLTQELGWIDEVLGFWVNQSEGTITSFARAGAVATFALPSGMQCDAGSGLWNTARAAFPGVRFGAGDHLVVLAPASMNGVSCTFGLGSIGSGMSSGGSLSVNDASQLRGGLAHEIGHNLGLLHSDSQSCDPIDGTSCAVSGYDGTYDVMGISPGGKPPALRSFARDWFGISQTCEVPRVSLAPGQRTSTATYDLFPRSGTSGTRGLRVTAPVGGGAYYLDWRTKLGQDSEWGGSTSYPGGKARGVTLERVSTGDPRTAVLVPAARSAQGVVSWSASPGMTRTVAGGGMKFTVDSAGSGSTADSTAQVTVTLTDESVASAPILPEQSGTLGLPSLVQEATSVSAAPSAWTPGSCYRYEWSLDGVGPVGRGATYAVPAGSTGRRLTLTVTGQQSGFAPLTRTISRTIGTPEPEATPVPTANPSSTPVPSPVSSPSPNPVPTADHIVVLRPARLVGRSVVGSILRVRARWETDDVRVSYHWYVDNTRVAHGSRPRLRLRGAYVGQRVRVAVVARAQGMAKVRVVPKRRVRVQARG